MSQVALHLIVLRCADVERSRAFYAAVGLDPTPERHGSGPPHYSCAMGAIVLELYPQGSQPPTVGVRIGLSVADVRIAVEAVRALGTGEVMRVDDHHTQALLGDPDGNAVHLSATTL
jgi:hypothetical protein